MYLVVTIDTEEDNWGDYRQTGQFLENIKEIPHLQKLFDEFGVRPTYLITYPVAEDSRSIAILKKILEEGKCEIGAHCHPWNTPPFEEEKNKRNNMLSNIPFEIQYEKVKKLSEIIHKNFGKKPISFRSGRWGFNSDTALAINKLGYRVDSSITPYTTWVQNYGPDFSDLSPDPFLFYEMSPNSQSPSFLQSDNNSSFNFSLTPRFARERIKVKDILSIPNIGNNFRELSVKDIEVPTKDLLLEIPVSIGFLQKKFELANKILKNIQKINHKFRLIGILNKLGLLKKVWLSPEISTSNQMINLSKVLMTKNIKILNMTFHSVTLIPGFNHFAKTENDLKEFYKRIYKFLEFCKESGIKPITLSETINLLE